MCKEGEEKRHQCYHHKEDKGQSAIVLAESTDCSTVIHQERVIADTVIVDTMYLLCHTRTLQKYLSEEKIY